ncbi:hypothetical protein ACH4SP_07920 [Streptomyces sp. NPDC021093]|uniref:hypothetical protein n=1 Tax=Streptomyces sp. NPDC021093 TaxID=3365112 RepID=UPI0037AAD707
MLKARIATVLGGVAAATLFTISSASAVIFSVEKADDAPWDASVPSAMKCVSNSVGKACYRRTGDWFEIVDHKEDGRSALVAWRSIYPESQATIRQGTIRQGTIWNTAGFQKYRYKNKDFTEGYVLEFRVCAGTWGNKHVVDSTCSAWTTTKS